MCVEVVEFGTDRALVRHLYWKSLAWLPMTPEYGPRIWAGTKDLLVFETDLDHGNIPWIPSKESPKTLEDFIMNLMRSQGYFSGISNRYMKLD